MLEQQLGTRETKSYQQRRGPVVEMERVCVIRAECLIMGVGAKFH